MEEDRLLQRDEQRRILAVRRTKHSELIKHPAYPPSLGRKGERNQPVRLSALMKFIQVIEQEAQADRAGKPSEPPAPGRGGLLKTKTPAADRPQ